MSTKKDFEIFLYKNKLNAISLIDILSKLSSKTIKYLMDDLNIEQENVNKESDEQNNNLYIFTDGNCKNNGKYNSRAAYGVFFTDDMTSPYYKFNTCEHLKENEPTNQKAELTAMLTVFNIIDKNIELFISKNIIICTDSMYTLKCIKEWYVKWEKNNWKTSKGEIVKNVSLIKSIIELKKQLEQKQINIQYKHVFSHTSEPFEKNNKAYKLWYGNKTVDDMINKIL